MILGLDHVALGVRDLGRAAADYEILLGQAPARAAEHARFQLSNMALDLVRADTEGLRDIGFAVDDLSESCRVLERRGLTIPRQDGERAELTPSSTDGIPIVLIQRRAGAGAAPGAAIGLDHIVIQTTHPNRAAALYGARLGLDLRLDRTNEQWGSRLLFFRCGDCIVEIGASLKAPPSDAPDRFGGLAWRLAEPNAAHARLTTAGFDVSDIRKGRKAGTQVFTVKSRTASVPTLMIAGGGP